MTVKEKIETAASARGIVLPADIRWESFPNELPQPGEFKRLDEDAWYILAYPADNGGICNTEDFSSVYPRKWGAWSGGSPAYHAGYEMRTPAEVPSGQVYLTRKSWGGMGEHHTHYLACGSKPE